jgi:hypothetical protein
MSKRMFGPVVALAMFLAVSTTSQQLPPRTYRFVSEWKIPRQDSVAYAAELEKSVRPVLQNMMQDGTVFDFGLYTTIVKEDEGITHGYWFEIPTLPAMGKVLNELAKLPPSNLANSASKQHDYLFRILLRNSRPNVGTNGIFCLNSTLLLPRRQAQWREWWDKYQKPMYDQFLAEGRITSYEVDTGEIHTMDANWVYLAYVAPNFEALDKIDNAFRIRVEKRAAEENQAINSALDAIVVAGSHRDYLARATSYAAK